jgi:dipeptidyl aminopeptidase/acylaminoacyl peptidase
VVLSAPVRAEGASCPAVWPPRAPDQPVSLLTTEGLLTLRDIAQPLGGAYSSGALAVSPGRDRVAIFVNQPVLEANDTCETLLVFDVATPKEPMIVDSGGGAIEFEQTIYGLRYSSGFLEGNIPAWSPDGSALVYRKRAGGRTQAWLARLDGSPARQLTRAEQDVESVAWSPDGKRVLYSVRPGRTTLTAAHQAEAKTGILYDARILPQISIEPQLPEDLPEQIMAISAVGGEALPASESDRAAFKPPIAIGQDLLPAPKGDGRIADAKPAAPSYFASRTLHVTNNGGTLLECHHPDCTGAVRDIWWHGEDVMFLKRAGWHDEDSVIQAWSPRHGTVRTVLRTMEAISDCTDTQAGVLCIAEDARHPRRIIAIDPVGGARREFFDPNPEIDIANLPTVKRLRWRNNLGLETWADLVLPKGTPPPGGWPMVIVQYRSRGFLRGGTGDEYPIYPMVGRGMAVFSFERPAFPPASYNRADDMSGTVAALNRNWSDRWSVHDSLMRGLDIALSSGAIDPTRIGSTGMSDGSTTTRFALINQNRFAAAAISTCCIGPISTMAFSGTAIADYFRRVGFPDASRPDPDFWRPASMALNAERMNTPLLMQLADTEYIDALDTFTALREHGKPVEMYVFPGEFHDKSQPVHRAAIYQRNLDWFSFWLQGRVDADPAKSGQYQRWEAMKSVAKPAPSGP